MLVLTYSRERRLQKARESAAKSRARKKDYISNLEMSVQVLTTEKLELQVKVASLTNNIWEKEEQVAFMPICCFSNNFQVQQLQQEIQELKAQAKSSS